jgi:hypothetical protein
LTRLAIITNFQAGRNRTRPELIRELSRKAGGECREVGGLDSIRTVIREIMDERVDILGINGGDGTVHGALTELMRLGCELPELAVIPGGTTNMTANDFNDNAPLEVTLHRLAEEASTSREDRRIVTRPMLRASADGLEPQYGFFLGAGAILDGMDHFREKVGSMGLRGELAAGISVVRGLAGLIRGDSAWTREHDTSLRTAGDSVIDKQVLVLATTLERMLLGLKPWWGRGSGPIHVTGLRRKPREVLRRAPAFLRGRPHPGLTVENGYYSENVAGFEVRPDSGFALDGEIFDPGPGAPVDVSATDPIRFLRLDGR